MRKQAVKIVTMLALKIDNGIDVAPQVNLAISITATCSIGHFLVSQNSRRSEKTVCNVEPTDQFCAPRTKKWSDPERKAAMHALKKHYGLVAINVVFCNEWLEKIDGVG